jgi:uncharacterized cupin superfamily protein
MGKRHPQVVNIDEVAPREATQGGFGYRTRRLAPEAGGRAIGCSHYELPPGQTSFPFHFHSAIEEVLYILEGTGTLRVGKDEVALRAGDYVALPPGPEHAHTLTAGAAALRYLCLSGPAAPTTWDVVGYPDSRKLAVAAGADPTKGIRSGWVFKLIKEDQPAVDYYDDEPLAKK